MSPDAMGVKVRLRDGAYWVVIDHRGKRRSKKIGEEETAHEVARKIRERLSSGDLGLLSPPPAKPLEQFATDWLKAGEGVWKSRTFSFYEFNLRVHIVPVLGRHIVSELKRRDCRELLTTCRAKGLKRSSLCGVNRTVSSMLSQAVEDELLQANPAFRMGKHLRFADDEENRVCPLSREELQVLLKTAEQYYPTYYPLFLCAARTGLRLGEYLGLELDAVDSRNRSIKVSRNRVGGKITTPKNRRQRVVDMSNQLTEVLANLIAERRKTAFAAGTPMPKTVFLTPSGEPVDGDNLRHRIFYPLLKKAGLRHCRLHDLRHTYASLLIQNGESLKYVSEQMGHSSIKVTADIYGHLIPGANKAAVDRLDDPIRNPGATEADAPSEEIAVSD
jgi:integrase